MTEMPFGFTWCYEETDDEGEQCLVLILGDPEDVPPLDIDISNILPDQTITISPIDGVNQADANNYHFKLAFSPGILADPQAVGLESADWSISSVSNSDEDSIYLLWTGAETLLSSQNAMKVILTGVAAQSEVASQSVEISTTTADTEGTTTDVNISWKFYQGGIEVMSLAKIPEGGDYDENITLTLNMVQSTGKSNIPLYVGFVNCNKVLNTYDEASNLQLRITNTNLPAAADADLTFHYDSDINLSSQLVVTLEVGTETSVPWALATEDQVNDIAISIAGDQWKQNGDIEKIEIDGVVQALQWTFIPENADVVLAARKTMLINLDNIVTSHPTGETNLYLSYQYVPGYKDGQFVCQIEKAPLVFDTKVRVGMRKELEGLLNVKDGVSLYRGDIQHTGPILFRSDVDQSGDSDCALFYKQDETKPFVKLKHNGRLEINGPDAKQEIETQEMLKLQRPGVTGVKDANTVAFKVGAFEEVGSGGTQLDIVLSGTAQESNSWGENADTTVMILYANRDVRVKGRIKDKTGYVVPVGTIVPYAGTSAPQGWLWCHGQTFDTSDYPDLHDVLGSNQVPNLKNRFLVGAGDTYALNATGGEDQVILKVEQMPSHNHAPDSTFKYVLKVDGNCTTDKNNNTSGEPNLGSAKAMGSRGGGQSHENRPPYYALNYIIKA